MDTCKHCGKALTGHTKRAIFCDKRCKEDWRSSAQSAAALARRAGRICLHCGQSFTPASAKARTCSRACGVAWQNDQRQAKRRAAWELRKAPCAYCGGKIGPERNIGSKYCSVKCKRLKMGDYFRARMPGYQRQHRYGITPEHFAELLAKQDGRCAICRTDAAGGMGGWNVDHEHGTGRIRGLLCVSCNNGLGRFHDDPAILRAALEYVMR